MVTNGKNDSSEGSWQGFRGGVRVICGSDHFDLVCGQSGRRYPSGRLNAPVAADNYQAGRFRELLLKCKVDDGLKSFVMSYDGNNRKSLLLMIQVNKDDSGVEVDGIGVRRIKELRMPACILEAMNRIAELFPKAEGRGGSVR